MTNFASVTGKGVTGISGGRRIAVGNDALLKERGVVPSADPQTHAAALSEDNSAAPFVAVDGKLADIIAGTDPKIAASLVPARRATGTISTAEPFRAQVERWVAQDVAASRSTRNWGFKSFDAIKLRSLTIEGE